MKTPVTMKSSALSLTLLVSISSIVSAQDPPDHRPPWFSVNTSDFDESTFMMGSGRMSLDDPTEVIQAEFRDDELAFFVLGTGTFGFGTGEFESQANIDVHGFGCFDGWGPEDVCGPTHAEWTSMRIVSQEAGPSTWYRGDGSVYKDFGAPAGLRYVLVPEPGAITLLLIGALSIFGRRRS